MSPVRLLLDGSARGAWNMAVDEGLLEEAARAGSPTLRFYGWSEPTVSLGYFQPLADRAQHSASAHCAIVRRTTGGGAIVHDRELTYSFVLPHATPRLSHLAAGAAPLYEVFHRALIRVLKHCGLAAAWCHPQQPALGPQNEPFLCFQRRAEGDVILGAHKLAGSAQRRQGAATLQHGSVLLAASPAAPELPGMAELLGGTIERGEVIDRWLAELRRDLAVDFAPGCLTEAETAAARRLAVEKFADSRWLGKR